MQKLTKQQFEDYKSKVSQSEYLLRCLKVGDEEQWQHDTNFLKPLAELMEIYGLNEEDTILLARYFLDLDTLTESPLEEQVITMLEKYMGLRDIMEKDINLWEEIVCGTWEGYEANNEDDDGDDDLDPAGGYGLHSHI